MARTAHHGADLRMFGLGCVLMLVVTTLMNRNPFAPTTNGPHGLGTTQSAKALHHKHHMLGVPHTHDGLSDDDVLDEHRPSRHGPRRSSHAAEGADTSAVTKEEDFTPKFPEHIKSMRESTYHEERRDTWEERGYSRPYLTKEREAPCATAEATAHNVEGVAKVRWALDNVEDHFPINLAAAKQCFRQAMEADPWCAAPRLNMLMSLMAEAVTEDDGPDGEPCNAVEPTPKEAMAIATVLEGFNGYQQDHWTPKMYIWRGILEEFKSGQIHAAWYQKGIDMDPALKAEYMHPTYVAPTILLDTGRKEAAPMLRRALIQLLFFYEFAPAFGAYGKLTYEDVLRFKRDWHLKVKDFIPQYCYFILSRYYGSMVDRKLGRGVAGYKGSGTFESNGDALNTWYNVKVSEFVSRLAGTEVTPTYGYTAGYIKNDVLKWHTDRKSCEFTLTTLIIAHPNPIVCPLYIQKTPWPIDQKWVGRYEEEFLHRDDVINVRPQVNELVIIRGRAVPHYRPPLASEAQCTTFMLHYVPTSDYHPGCDTPEQCGVKS